MAVAVSVAVSVVAVAHALAVRCVVTVRVKRLSAAHRFKWEAPLSYSNAPPGVNRQI